MNATFVQVDTAELAQFKADPSSVEALFQSEAVPPDAFTKFSKAMQDRMRAAGPQMLADTLSRLDPSLQQRLAERLGKTPASLDANDILQLIEARFRGAAQASSAASTRTTLSLDKAWHGVHYILCGESEPGASLLSRAVLGGAALGEDDEGFSGYGPPRYFTAAQVAELAATMKDPNLESEAAARFDAERMSELGIYPGWRASDADWVLDGFRRLRDFYSDAAAKGRAIVTCLV